MKPVATLYDEYIGRPKLTQQKIPFEYIVPSPSRGVGTITKNELRESGNNIKASTEQVAYK